MSPSPASAGPGVAAALDEPLCTPSLRLAPCDADAALALARIVADPRVAAPFRFGRAPTGAAAADWVQAPDDWQARARLRIAVRLQDGEPVGALQFHGAHLSYFLAPAVWRRGLGREMVEAACRRYPPLLGLGWLQASVIRENVGSRRILEATGFVFRGLQARRWAGGHGHATMLRYERAAQAVDDAPGAAARPPAG